MKETRTNSRVTLTAENSRDAVDLAMTSYEELRRRFNVPAEKELALDYANDGSKSVQINTKGGGFTVKDEV